MNKRPGQIKVTVETGFCSFCDRTRNLRREERQLGALVRTVTSCESCHRVLSSTIGVAESDAATEAKTAPAAAKPEPATATAQRKSDAAPPPKAAVKPKAAAKPKTQATRSRPSK
ncbi:MAG TPA: hypothetical protein VIN12_02510 [Candidatus Dormibacteraeota bacterium]